MYRKFLNARSPLRLLEKGLHGGLGNGNLGLVLAGHGVGKTAFLVGMALDEMLRGGTVLHVATDQTVAHVRAHYDTTYETLAVSTQLEDAAVTHAEIDRHRSIRAYSPDAFSASKLREAVKVEVEAGSKPTMIMLDGMDLGDLARDQIQDVRAVAQELDVEIWMTVACAEEKIDALPASVEAFEDSASVILALEPGDESVALRAIKDHESPDVSALHVALDPKTLLLIRS
jgi:hypothetical protein